MRHGHVAVVTRVINSREVLVDHANWAPHRGRGRGQISKMVAVTDVSPRNDWTEVRVWNAPTGDFGTRTYPTYGFIYPSSMPTYYRPAVVTVQDTVAAAKHRLAPTEEARPVSLGAEGAGTLAITTGRGGPTPAKEAKLSSGKAAETAAQKVPVATAEPAPAAKGEAVAMGDTSAEGVWEGDLAAAQMAGAGHY